MTDWSCTDCGYVVQKPEVLRETVSPGYRTGRCTQCGATRMFRATVAPDTKTFDGATYQPSKDRKRLNRQYQAVWDAMADGRWYTLQDLHNATGYPEASISARMRDFRKPRNGGHDVEHRRGDAGVWFYRLIIRQPVAAG